MLGVRLLLMTGAPACRVQWGREARISDPWQGHPKPPPQPRGHHPVRVHGKDRPCQRPAGAWAPNITGGTHPPSQTRRSRGSGGVLGAASRAFGVQPRATCRCARRGPARWGGSRAEGTQHPPRWPRSSSPAAGPSRAASPRHPLSTTAPAPRSSSFSALCSPRGQDQPPRSSSCSSPAGEGKPAAMRGPAPRARRGEAWGLHHRPAPRLLRAPSLGCAPGEGRAGCVASP